MRFAAVPPEAGQIRTDFLIKGAKARALQKFQGKRSERNNKSESREAGRTNSLTIFAKGSSDFFKKSPHLRILERLGVPQKGRDEGKDLCKAFFELAKKLPEIKENKVAEKRKNLRKEN